MKAATCLTLATAASAFVLPESIVGDVENVADLPWKLLDTVTRAGEDFFSSITDTAKEFSKEFSHWADAAASSSDSDWLSTADLGARGIDLSNLTIYEIIAKSNHSTKFFEALKGHDKVVKLLNGTDANYTLFVPIDKAFEHIPDHDKPSDEFIEQALTYHIANGTYGAHDLLFTHTIPSALHEYYLGGKPQRLRTSVSLWGLKINAYSKVVYANVKAKNGYIHAVDKILVPPTWIGRILNLIPSEFSTLVLAFSKTNFGQYIHGIETVGSTVFAPTNKAWEKLGPRANAFLFNTEKGKEYLLALLKYQVVANTTLYSDEVYYGDKKDGGEDEAKIQGHFHIELNTLLGKSLGVDIHSWKGWASMVVNGAVGVSFLDGIGKNGVLQVVSGVPIPSRHPGAEGVENVNGLDGEIEVEDLIALLDPYLEGAKEEKFSQEL